jgi:hypothetical protein
LRIVVRLAMDAILPLLGNRSGPIPRGRRNESQPRGQALSFHATPGGPMTTISNSVLLPTC